VALHFVLEAADTVLQLASRSFEGIVERETEVRKTLIVLGRVGDGDIARRMLIS
jgi:hypothetical protein